ncbi:pre-mRNA processing RNA-helicase, partial [Coemansia aciculifera]
GEDDGRQNDSDGGGGDSTPTVKRGRTKDNKVDSGAAAAAVPEETEKPATAATAATGGVGGGGSSGPISGIPAAAQAALLAAQAAAQRLAGSSSSGPAPSSLSVVDQINQQLGIPVAAASPGSGDFSVAAAIALARSRASNIASGGNNNRSSTPGGSGTPTAASSTVAAQGASAVPVGTYGCELDINDYPQKARWRATNHETLLQVIEHTGAAITTRGIYVPPGKPVPEGERKLYLSIESDSERSAEQAKTEIKRLLTEATILVMEQDAARGGPGSGRYSVV